MTKTKGRTALSRPLLGLLFVVFNSAFGTPLQTCKRFIPPIAKEVGVPVSLLKAIASVESNHQPYALNHQGISLSFRAPGEAWVYAEKRLNTGDTNLDMGCMQVNWRAHQSKVGDARKLLIPTFNIRYAATFLKSLYQELGSWSQAVAAYHSRTPAKGQGYLIKVARILQEEKALFLKDQKEAIVSRREGTGFTSWTGQSGVKSAGLWKFHSFLRPAFLFQKT